MVRVSTDKSLLLLLEMCRQGPAPEPYAVVDGLARYRWKAQGLGVIELAIPAADEVLAATVARASTKTKAWMELLATLIRAVELDGVEEGWCGERVAELLYGFRLPGVSSHRERKTPPLAGWTRLLSEALWSIDTRSTGDAAPTALPPPRGRLGKPKKQPKNQVPLLELHLVDQPLVTLQRETPTSKKATVRVHPELRACLGQVYVPLPAKVLLIPLADHQNPEGHRPSLAAQGRIRIASAICARWRRRRPQPVKLEELLDRWAGLDVAAVRRRGHLATWFDTITSRLSRLHAQTGTGLAAVPARRALLNAALSLVCSLPGAAHPPRAGPVATGPAP